MLTLAVSGAARSTALSQAMPGVLGFLVVAGMGVALFFLLRSMNKQLRKVTPPGPGTPGRPGRLGRPGRGGSAGQGGSAGSAG